MSFFSNHGSSAEATRGAGGCHRLCTGGSLIFCKFLDRLSRFVVGALQPPKSRWLRGLPQGHVIRTRVL